MRNLMLSLLALSFFGLVSCQQGCQKTAAQPRVFFANLKDGQTLPPTFPVVFGVEGMTVRPAGEDVADRASGHHHILIDDAMGFVPKGQVVPKDSTHLHFGKGETETTLTLSPGPHRLSLQFADGAHLSYGQEMSATINVTVAEPVQLK